MNKLQFRVLYREFLFRMVDLELLSPQAQGDMSKLFGQFASLLIVISILLTVPALGLGGRHKPANPAAILSLVHFLIATTMLAVGLFAVLSWDSTFPDKRDVMVLAPLPVHTRTLFLAKASGIAVYDGPLLLPMLLFHRGLHLAARINVRLCGRRHPILRFVARSLSHLRRLLDHHAGCRRVRLLLRIGRPGNRGATASAASVPTRIVSCCK